MNKNKLPASEIKSFGKFEKEINKGSLIRKGYCCQCGECCSNRTLMSDKDAKQMIEALKEGADKFPRFSALCLRTAMDIKRNRNHQCQHLEKRKGGKWICRIYEKRPEFCKTYPAKPGDIHNVKNCTYYFGKS